MRTLKSELNTDSTDVRYSVYVIDVLWIMSMLCCRALDTSHTHLDHRALSLSLVFLGL